MLNAYEGTSPYIFISYAHKDSSIVMPIVEALNKAGYLVWFDGGIEAGSEWPEYIAAHLRNSACVLLFISENFVASDNCKRELTFALDLKKPTLSVYITSLDETDLSDGMRMQLGLNQSIKRTRFENDGAFVSALLKAKIISECNPNHSPVSGATNINLGSIPSKQQPTTNNNAAIDREAAINSGNRNLLKKALEGGPSLIANVGTKPSNDPSNAWPLTAYSNVIDVDSYRAVHFHVDLVKKFDIPGERKIGLQIYNSSDALVYDYSTSLYFKNNFDRFTLCWVVKSEQGMPMSPGIYTAVIWIENSRAVEYRFQLKSKDVLANNNTVSMTEEEKKQKEKKQKEIDGYKKKLKHPKILLFANLILVSFLVFLGFSGVETFPALLALIAFVVFIVITYKLVRANVVKNRFLAFIFVFPGFYYLIIYSFIISIIAWVNKKSWTEKIKEFEQNNLNQ